MITLRKSEERELELFASMELQDHAYKFVNSTGVEVHRRCFKNPNIIYLSIVNSDDEVYGYFILAIEEDFESIEFRRILIDESRRGVGQLAIAKMENYCRKVLNANQIWLDVYEDNLVGRHIYEKLGYKKFRESEYEGRKLLFFQKAI